MTMWSMKAKEERGEEVAVFEAASVRTTVDPEQMDVDSMC